MSELVETLVDSISNCYSEGVAYRSLLLTASRSSLGTSVITPGKGECILMDASENLKSMEYCGFGY